jgi:hypothetical protein
MFLVSFKNLTSSSILGKRVDYFNLNKSILTYKHFSKKPIIKTKIKLTNSLNKLNLSNLFNFKRHEKFMFSLDIHKFQKYYKVNFLSRKLANPNKKFFYKNFETKVMLSGNYKYE